MTRTKKLGATRRPTTTKPATCRSLVNTIKVRGATVPVLCGKRRAARGLCDACLAKAAEQARERTQGQRVSEARRTAARMLQAGLPRSEKGRLRTILKRHREA